MTRLNFREFELPLDVAGRNRRKGDARESLANVVYQNMGGIRAHALALKIFKSEGWEEYTDDEVALIRQATEKYCLPPFIDGLQAQIDNQETKEE